MALRITEEQNALLSSAIALNEKFSTRSGRRVWTEERELEIVKLVKDGVSTGSIIREQRVSGRKIMEIRKKYKLWGA